MKGFCQKCGNLDCPQLVDLILEVEKDKVHLMEQDKLIRVCPTCQGWFNGIYHPESNRIRLQEGIPVGLYKIALYKHGIKPPKKPKKEKTLQEAVLGIKEKKPRKPREPKAPKVKKGEPAHPLGDLIA